jgi:hypothetical protein
VNTHFDKSLPLWIIPAYVAMLAAVVLASPVIIMTLTPAVWQSSIDFGTSGLIGSMMHTTPIKVALLSY